MSDESGGNDQPIVIKKIVQGGGHHGGAWKVAYADFVTAMMAFFLLMWLLSMASEEQLDGIADYFSPTIASTSSESGGGGVMGGMSLSIEGARKSDTTPVVPPPESLDFSKGTEVGQSPNETVEAQAKEELKEQEEAQLEAVKDAIEAAITESPELSDLAENLMIDMTREGLRIQVVDSEGKPMFPSGSARMYNKTRELMLQVGKAIKSVPNEISVRGHTDSIPYGSGATYTNWELSTDRANSSRRVIADSGIESERLNDVVGKADTEHLLPDNPTNARNRRISIILLREELTDPEAYQKRVEKLAEEKREKAPPPPRPNVDGTTPSPNTKTTPSIPKPRSGQFNKTDGDVQFP